MDPFVVVTGATGQQGGAVARALLARGAAVHALVRDTESARAVALARAGATLVAGDLDDPDSLERALAGARGLFSVQTPDMADVGGDSEARHARNLAAAARAAGTEQIVHTSVSGADRGPVDEARWGTFPGHYLRTKTDAERRMQEAASQQWTVLRPALFLENFVPPSLYFPDPDRPHHLLMAVDLDVTHGWVAVDDIGAAAAAAFADPTRFDEVELELAGERQSFRQVARTISGVTGIDITVPDSPEQARAEGVAPELALYQSFVSAHPYPADPASARALGLSLTTVQQWARATFGARLPQDP